MSAAGLSAPVVAAALVLGLCGCSAVQDAVEHQTQGRASTRAALLHDWPTHAAPPVWVPEDATDLRYIAATGGADAAGSPAAVRVTTRAALPATCARIERRSMDPFGVDWAPAIPDTIERCGDWAVVPASGGWYGWTPLAPSESTESPAP